MQILTPFKTITVSLFVLFFLTACSNEEATEQTNNTPVAIESGDECHLCGMVIAEFPGPKGELFEGRKSHVRKFCSTRDLMSWYLQPENRPNTKEIYVHDMSRSDWNSPSDEHMINAREAWFVAGSSMKGAMGPTLASFAQKDAAEKFVTKHGGTVLEFKAITMEILNTGSAMNMGSMHH
ncbi:nitrous oxide reductase accessory protein NosL [Alkalimarinus sediminis]|uniref:Nitrous oxide reductase accessory protein NosL n=1 Tax=Alkalimarinus sediminis TaxID=1632866 RepID=A0A9E8HH76_9ALTE|nr:nitrous oxide reductase accessory protein NosL [Alkalimarinus sediminis]UZW74364.1 nitrous oxide reductase accessory protein NosL [Alkalimarinus sediminis]